LCLLVVCRRVRVLFVLWGGVGGAGGWGGGRGGGGWGLGGGGGGGRSLTALYANHPAREVAARSAFFRSPWALKWPAAP